MNRFAHYRRTIRRGLHRSGQRGMTLIEIMVVMTILGLMAAAITVAVLPALDKSKVDKAKLDMHQLMQGLDVYYTQHGKFPDTGEGLQSLVSGKQIDSLHKDPWGNDYVYTLENGKPVITCYGADGAPGGDDLAKDLSTKDPDFNK